MPVRAEIAEDWESLPINLTKYAGSDSVRCRECTKRILKVRPPGGFRGCPQLRWRAGRHTPGGTQGPPGTSDALLVTGASSSADEMAAFRPGGVFVNSGRLLESTSGRADGCQVMSGFGGEADLAQ